MLKWRFVLTETGKVIREFEHEKIAKQKRKLRKLIEKEKSGAVEKGTAEKCQNAWLANAAHGNTHKIQESIKEYYKTLMNGEQKNERSTESRTD